MSVNITKNEDGTFSLLKDGIAINNKSYYRINRLNDNSNYFQLWPNEKCFYLYHQKNGKFARNSVTDRDADLFKEIRHYSYRTHSFAAYRSDSSQAHLIYESGDIPKDVFIEIGDESDDESRSRPVKYYYSGQRWCFYNTLAQQFIWPKGSGYLLNENQSLCSRFNNGFFSIYNSDDEVYQLAFYDQEKTYPYEIKQEDGTKVKRQGHLYFFNYRFVLIQPHGKYLTCKAKDGIYYVFDTLAKEKAKRLCTSVDEPIFSNDLIFISSELAKQVFWPQKSKIIENDTWKRDCEFKVCRDYIFVTSHRENVWKVFSLQDGHEVYTDLNIVNVELVGDNVACQVHNPNDVKETVNIADIKHSNKKWLERMAALLNESQNQAVATLRPVKEDAKPIETPPVPVFPNHIDFVISAKAKIRPQSTGVIQLNRKASQLQPNNIILFYDKDANKVFIVRYLHKAYHIIYSKQFDSPLTFSSSIPDSFVSCFVGGLTEENFLEKIKKALVKDDIRRNSISIEKRYSEVTEFLKKKEFKDDLIQKALQVLLPDYFEKEKEIQELSRAKFVFKDVEYSLRPDEVWQVDNPFYKQSFLDKKDYVAVLVESGLGFKEGSELPGTHYEMRGKGKEGDQSYENPSRTLNTNGVIRDNKKRVFLFRRIKDGKIVFFDEVECRGSREEREYHGDNYRIIIKFFLRSKLRSV